ncbi:hypothetical protein B0H10DRAFT_268513 [Mycena sp. CBHHK59/15]|nr:hypothetical protein B0H10DRAFT_268513 [Mycena sp. CBHHK59/15]
MIFRGCFCACPAAPALAATGPCNATDVQSTISQMKDVANQILSVGLVAPDPFRQSDASAATFDQVVSAINDAGTAAASSDFATVSSKLSFIDDTVNGLLSGLDVQDGLESGVDLQLSSLADDAVQAVAACAAPATAAAEPAAAPATPAPAPAARDDDTDSGVCDAASLESNLGQMKDVASQILSVGLVLPDPFRQNDASAATFDQVVSGINDAITAVASSDFATVASKLSFVDDAVNGLLSGLDVQDGLESGVDLQLSSLSDDTLKLATACA